MLYAIPRTHADHLERFWLMLWAGQLFRNVKRHFSRRSGVVLMNLSKQMMIGEILIMRGIITRNQLNMAKKFQEPARKCGETLVDNGVISPNALDIALGWQLAEALVGLGYAREKDVFGSLRISVATERTAVATDSHVPDQFSDKDLKDLADF